MTKLFFHLRNGVDVLIDPEGCELSLAEAKARALVEVRALIADEVRSGLVDLRQRIEVENAGGVVVHTIWFGDAVAIIS